MPYVNGKYEMAEYVGAVVPDGDQCPDCRAAPGEAHNPGCGRETDSDRIPFHVQGWLFEELAPWKADVVWDLIQDHGEEITQLARERFRAGYRKYDSNMYHWTAEVRRSNVLEEIADAIVYLTSGPIT